MTAMADTLVPLSETLIELALPGLRALTERLSQHLVITEHGRGIPTDVERQLLAEHRKELTLTVAFAMLASITSPHPDICYGGYLPTEGDTL
jgi:hypothetical protein